MSGKIKRKYIPIEDAFKELIKTEGAGSHILWIAQKMDTHQVSVTKKIANGFSISEAVHLKSILGCEFYEIFKESDCVKLDQAVLPFHRVEIVKTPVIRKFDSEDFMEWLDRAYPEVDAFRDNTDKFVDTYLEFAADFKKYVSGTEHEGKLYRECPEDIKKNFDDDDGMKF
jgi:hypothetical protein